MARGDLSIGAVIAERYRVQGVVGRGGMGAVYRALDETSGRTVALKVLLANYSSRHEDMKRFEREAMVLQKLDHPHIVDFLDYGHTDDGEPFMAFELLTGESLRDRLDKGHVPIADALVITRDILSALAAAHERGIVHRDIKPQNVFLSDEQPPRAIVLDFGVAKVVEGGEQPGNDLTKAGQIVGSAHYMAPEQVRGKAVSPATDIYALGLVVCEMVTGKRLVAGDAPIDVYMLHVDPKPHAFPTAIRLAAFGPVIEKACDKDPAKRYAHAAAMLEAFDGALSHDRGPNQTFVIEEEPEPAERDDELLETSEVALPNEARLDATVMMPEMASDGATLDRTVDDFAVTVDHGKDVPETVLAEMNASVTDDAATIALDEMPLDVREAMEEARRAVVAGADRSGEEVTIPEVASNPDPLENTAARKRKRQKTLPPFSRESPPAPMPKADKAMETKAERPVVTVTEAPSPWRWVLLVVGLLLLGALGFGVVTLWLSRSG